MQILFLPVVIIIVRRITVHSNSNFYKGLPMLTPDRSKCRQGQIWLTYYLLVAFQINHTKSCLFLDINYQAPIILVPKFGIQTIIQCCVSGFGIRCLFDPWIRDLGPWIQTLILESLVTIFCVKLKNTIILSELAKICFC